MLVRDSPSNLRKPTVSRNRKPSLSRAVLACGAHAGSTELPRLSDARSKRLATISIEISCMLEGGCERLGKGRR